MSEDICTNNHGGNPRSVEAFDASNFKSLRDAVYGYVKSRGAHGATTDEVRVVFASVQGNTSISARMSELKKDGRIARSGKQRRTRSGSGADVMVVAALANAIRPAAATAQPAPKPMVQATTAEPEIVFDIDKPEFQIPLVVEKKTA